MSDEDYDKGYDLNNLRDDEEMPDSRRRSSNFSQIIGEVAPKKPKSGVEEPYALTEWSLGGPRSFFACGTSYAELPAGFYSVMDGQRGLYALKQVTVSDSLCVLPGSCNHKVVDGIRKFWASHERYQRFGLSYKRGILFYGPPGAGKTATVMLLAKQLIEEHSGIVFACNEVGRLAAFLGAFRIIEPTRPAIIILEDIDQMIDTSQETILLALLDGEAQIDNCVYLATTNYPSRLGARIINRPARFDERIKVDMPSYETRKAYLRIVSTPSPINESDIAKWAMDTNGMSIAHLRELFIAVRCLDRDYAETLEQLRSMAIKPNVKEGISSNIGLNISAMGR